MFKQYYRPVLKLPKTTSERIWNIIGLSIFIGSIIYTFSEWGNLPDQIPAHFNAAGEVDRYGSKYELFILPVIGLLMWGLLELLERYPHAHNYPTRLNESNVEAFYLNSRKMLNIMKNLCLITFAFIAVNMVRIALGETDSLSIWFLPVVIIALLLPMIGGIVKQSKIR